MKDSLYDFVSWAWEWGPPDTKKEPDHQNMKVFDMLEKAQKQVYEILVYHKWVFTYKNLNRNLGKWRYFKFELNDFYIALLKYEIELGQVLDVNLNIERLEESITNKLKSLEKEKKWLSWHSGLKYNYYIYLIAKKILHKKYDFSYSFINDSYIKSAYALRIEEYNRKKKSKSK